jgi:hypothetical protein
MIAPDISVLNINSWAKSWEKPAAIPKTPPVRVVATSALRRPIFPASHVQAGPAGTETSFPRAASRPRWLLCSFRASAMVGKRVALRPASVLSTTVTPVRTVRFLQR